MCWLLFFLTFKDFGYPQETATESLKAFVANTPVRTDTSEGTRTIISPILHKSTVTSATANKSVAESSTKEDIFVDLFEYVNVLFDSAVSTLLFSHLTYRATCLVLRLRARLELGAF